LPAAKARRVSEPAIVRIPNGQFAQNCYLIADAASGEAVVVDPGEEWERILHEAETRGWRIGAIWLTHAHIDHILGVAGVREATGAPILLHPADRPLYDSLPEQALWFGFRLQPPPPPDRPLAQDDVLSVGPHRFRVRHAPGHSPGSVCLLGEGLALVGDVLFAGSIGRSDLPGGDGAELLRTIRRELLSLDDDTRVLPGHGPETTVGAERRSNPFLS